MLSGCPHNKRGCASALDQCWSKVGTLATSCEATVHSSPTDLSPFQNMVDTLVCGPPPGHYGFTQSQKVANPFMTSDTSVKQWVGHQSHLFKGHLHKDSNVNKDELQLKQSSKSSSGEVKRSHTISSQNKSSKKASPQTDNPLLFELLTTNDEKPMPQPSQKSEETSRQIVDISGISSKSLKTSASGGNKFLDDDQILHLIEEKLSKFRAEMKALKEKGQRKTCTKDSLNCIMLKSSHVPQAAACTSNSSALGRALEAQDKTKCTKDKDLSSSMKQDSERSKVKGNGTTSENHSPDYVRIMQGAAAICRRNEEESPIVTSLSGTTLDELLENPNLTLNCMPSKEEFKSQWLNVKSQEMDKQSNLGTCKVLNKMVQNTVTGVAGRPKLKDFSECTSLESAPVELALNTCVNQPPKAKEIPFVGQQQCTAGSHNQTANTKIHFSKVKFLPLSPSEGLVQELNEQQPIEELQTQGKELQAGLDKVEKLWPDCMAESLSLPKDCQYDDITDDEEESLTVQPSKRDVSLQYEDISDDEGKKATVEMPRQVLDNVNTCSNANTELEQASSYLTQCPNMDTSTVYEDISDNESLVLWKTLEQKEIAEPLEHMSNAELEQQAVADLPKQHLEMQLKCSCPYLIETEEGFEETPCPKCVKESTLEQAESQSEACKDDSLASCGPDNRQDQYESDDDDDDWLVISLTASDVKLVKDTVMDDSESVEENKDVPNPERGEPNFPCFKKIQEFDTWESFMQVKLKELNKSFPSGSANPFVASDKATSEHKPASCPESEDSCDTEDSCDYPSQSKQNYLTVPGHISPPPSYESDDALPAEDIVTAFVEDNVSKPPKRNNSSVLTISATDTQDADKSNFFPDLSTDEEESNYASNNQVISGFTFKNRPPNELTQKGTSLKCKEPKKRRFKKNNVLNSDSDDDEFNLQCCKNQKRSYLSGPGDVSCQQKKRKLDKIAQNPSSLKKGVTFSSELVTYLPEAHPKLAMKQKTSKSLADHNGKEKGKTTKKRPLPDADSKNDREEAMATSGLTNNEKISQTHRNITVSKPMNQNGKQFLRQSSLPNQSPSTYNNGILCRKVTKTVSLDGEASNLPACKLSQPSRQISISRANRVNSYSTESSTPAKQLLVKQWANSHVPTRAERRNCLDKDPSQNVPIKSSKKKDHELIAEAVPGPSYEPAPRQRHNSQESQTPLMKKTKLQAHQWTQARNRQGPKKQSRSVGKGYKWSESSRLKGP